MSNFFCVGKISQGKDVSSLRPAGLGRVQEDEIYCSTSIPESGMDDHYAALSAFQLTDGKDFLST